MKTPILVTERLLLRPLKITYADELFNNYASDPEVAKYMRWSTHKSVETTTEWLTFAENNYEKGNYFDWCFVLKETSEAIGSGGIYFDNERQMFELGYCIMKKHWNKGLVTEASRRIIDFAATELNQTEFFLKHAKENVASGKVAEKLGFIYSNDGQYSSFDGEKVFNSREYFLKIGAKQ